MCSELAEPRLIGRVPRDSVSDCPSSEWSRTGCLGARVRKDPEQLVSNLLGVGVEVEQDSGGDSVLLLHQREQDVLGPDVMVTEAQRFAKRALEDLLGARGERDQSYVRGGALVTGPDEPRHLRPSSAVTPSVSKAPAASPSSSRNTPSRRCSVPM